MANSRNKWLVGTLAAITISGAALWEGKRNTPYIPIKGDVATVCYGETKVKMRTYTDAECIAMLKPSLVKYGDAALKCIDVPINENQHAAFTLWTYNLGAGNFCGADFVRRLNRGDYIGACMGMATNPVTGKPAWSYAQGRYVQGLQNRRLYERNLCMKPVVEKALYTEREVA